MQFTDKDTWLDKLIRVKHQERDENSKVPSSAFSTEALVGKSMARNTATDYVALPIKLHEPDCIGPRTYSAGLSEDGKIRFGF